MVEKFHQELKEAEKNVFIMGDLAKEMLRKSVDSFKKLDVKQAEWVLSKKGDLADMDDAIEAKMFQMITLYQPMARDLRKIGCILKIITYLARIGRYGKDIANLTIELQDTNHVKKLVSIPHMAEIVCTMIDDALKVFESEDISMFNNFVERENSVDELRFSIFRECISYMMEDPKAITRCMHYTMVARYLERCGDHACKMAEKIYYMVTGQRVEVDCSKETSKACFLEVK